MRRFILLGVVALFALTEACAVGLDNAAAATMAAAARPTR